MKLTVFAAYKHEPINTNCENSLAFNIYCYFTSVKIKSIHSKLNC